MKFPPLWDTACRKREKGFRILRSADIKNPFNLYCVAGAIVAALEALRGIPYDCSWEELGLNEYKVTVWPVDERPEIAKRFIEEPAKIKEGHISLNRCSSCRMPKRAAELFEWRRNEGKLVNRKSGDRWYAFVSTTLPPIIRELAKELDDEIYNSLITSQRNWTIAHLDRLGVISGNSVLDSEEAGTAFLEYLDDFPVFGYGNPVDRSIEEDSCSITVENPFFVEQLAGILLGLYEGLFWKQGDIEWDEIGENKVTYRIESTGKQLKSPAGAKTKTTLPFG